MCYGTFRIARILALYTTAEITIRLGVVKDREEVQKLPAEAIKCYRYIPHAQKSSQLEIFRAEMYDCT